MSDISVTFSVVIPTYNRSDKLARALDSVVGQISQNCEVIVVDDGSEEGDKIAQVIAQYSGVQLVRLPANRGAAFARNAGVEKASGTWVIFLDSDDWWMPGRLDKLRDLAPADDVVLIHNRARVVRGGGISTRTRVGRAAPRGVRLEAALAAWNFVGGCSLICVRRSAFLDVGGFDVSLVSSEDWDLYVRLSVKGKFLFIPQALSYYDVGPHVRLTTSQKKIYDAHEVLLKRYAILGRSPRESRYIKATHYWVRSELALMFGDFWGALSFFASSIITMPTWLVTVRFPSFFLQSIKLMVRA